MFKQPNVVSANKNDSTVNLSEITETPSINKAVVFEVNRYLAFTATYYEVL